MAQVVRERIRSLTLRAMSGFVRKIVMYDVNVGGSYTWRVTEDNIVERNGKQFLRLLPYTTTFVRLVVEGIIDFRDLPKPPEPSPSLASSKGLAKLIASRNAAQLEELTPKCGLFAHFAVAKPKPHLKPKKKSRDDGPVLSIRVSCCPDAEYQLPEKTIKVLPPMRSDDPLCVEMNAETISYVVDFVRAHGVDISVLTSKRKHHKLSEDERKKPRNERYRHKGEDGEQSDGGEVEPGSFW